LLPDLYLKLFGRKKKLSFVLFGIGFANELFYALLNDGQSLASKLAGVSW